MTFRELVSMGTACIDLAGPKVQLSPKGKGTNSISRLGYLVRAKFGLSTYSDDSPSSPFFSASSPSRPALDLAFPSWAATARRAQSSNNCLVIMVGV